MTHRFQFFTFLLVITLFTNFVFGQQPKSSKSQEAKQPVAPQGSTTPVKRERRFYLTSKAYDQPEERGIEWARNPQVMQKLKQKRAEAEKLRDSHKPGVN